MKALLSTIGRGFHKWIGWKRLGIAASITVIAIAIVSLARTLASVDPVLVLSALREKSWLQIGAAAACVLGAYFTLTFYDLFALRTIGRSHVPYRIASLSSFTSYVIGHNIGATVFTGGAIRFRIYSDWGLSAIDVAKICFISGLTFWLGNTFVLGIGMAWHPEAAGAINLLPNTVNRAIGLAGLTAIALYLIWLAVKPRELGQNGWKVMLPSAPLTIVQILIGVVDLAFCSLAIYILMPAQPGIDFMSFAVAFILATLLGFATHAPGSLGVFDAAMLLALPQFDKAPVVASILIFRLLYFVMPFAISLTVMGSREIWYNVIDPMLQRRKQRLTSASSVATQKAGAQPPR
jgi:uncharacterized membrane protein YbhN (UPF0104 family)